MSVSLERDEFVEEALEMCRTSIEKHCKVFHPNRFTRPFSRKHYVLFEVIDDETVQKVLVIAHRGGGKTSIFTYALPSQHIIFEKSNFIVPASASSKLAIMQSENLKRHLLRDAAVRAIIGDIRSDEVFSQEDWVTRNGIYVLPRGWEQQVRGLLYEDSRPNLLIADDLEKTEAVLSDEQRLKLKAWFLTDFSNSVDRGDDDWRMFVVGTVLHEASLIEDLREDPTWTVIDMPLCDEEYKSYWPAFMSDEKVANLATEYENQGMLDAFYREYMNKAVATDTVFSRKDFRYYEEDGHFNHDPDVENVVLVDPTKSESPTSAFSAIVGVGIESEANRIYVRDVVNKRITADKLYDEVIDMADRIHASTIGLEVTGLQEFVTKPFLDHMLARGRHFNVIELKARKGQGEYSGRSKGKAGRVAALLPYYRLHRIYHNRATCGELELQLLGFPRPRAWDIMDAFAYIVEMTEIGQRYLTDETMPEDEDDEEADDRFEERCAALLELDEDPVEELCIDYV